MKVAIVGCGLSGLALAYFLKKQKIDFILFDRDEVASGASRIQSGLCHPYPGRSGKSAKFAFEALELTRELISAAESSIQERVALRTGLMRRGWVPKRPYEDVVFSEGGYRITSGLTVFMPHYLRGLFAFLQPCPFVKAHIQSLDDLREFDQIVLANGRDVIEFPFNLNFDIVKGHVLYLKTNIPLTHSILTFKGHLAPTREGLVQLGSTYEHHFETKEPDMELAKRELIPKLASFCLPEFKYEIVSVDAALRVANPESTQPCIQQVAKNVFVMTAMGSRGLLYHAYYGRLLASMLS